MYVGSGCLNQHSTLDHEGYLFPKVSVSDRRVAVAFTKKKQQLLSPRPSKMWANTINLGRVCGAGVLACSFWLFGPHRLAFGPSLGEDFFSTRRVERQPQRTLSDCGIGKNVENQNPAVASCMQSSRKASSNATHPMARSKLYDG